MTEVPNPAQFAERQRALAEVERDKVVRKRRKLKHASRLNSHVDQATLSKLAKVALPDADSHRKKGDRR